MPAVLSGSCRDDPRPTTPSARERHGQHLQIHGGGTGSRVVGDPRSLRVERGSRAARSRLPLCLLMGRKRGPHER